MSLHPLAKAFLELRALAGEKPFEILGVEKARSEYIRLSKLSVVLRRLAQIQDLIIALPDGEVPIRIYTPTTQENLPIYVFFHGGGWTLGNLDTMDALCRTIAKTTPCIVVSVDYHHAPEYKFPRAVHDAYQATQWIFENAKLFHGDPSRIAVGGVSAGANLAAAVCLMAKEKKSPQILHQILTVPVTNYDFSTKSYQDHGEGYMLTRRMMQWFWEQYLATESDGANPLASPLRAKDLSGLPSALVLTAEFDPLRDEGEAYAQRLSEAGVRVTSKRYAGMVHVFLGPESTQDTAKSLQQAFA